MYNLKTSFYNYCFFLQIFFFIIHCHIFTGPATSDIASYLNIFAGWKVEKAVSLQKRFKRKTDNKKIKRAVYFQNISVMIKLIHCYTITDIIFCWLTVIVYLQLFNCGPKRGLQPYNLDSNQQIAYYACLPRL